MAKITKTNLLRVFERLKNTKRKDFWLLLGLVIVILPVYASLLRPGFFPMQDDLQAFRIHQMNECISEFQIPCRWVPDAGYQYGYPQFNYYAPFVYYLGEAIHLTGFQYIDTVKILFVLGYLLSAVSMYVFVKSIAGRWPAFVSAVVYTYVPYKAVEVYVRGALSEFWSFVFFPLIFWSSFKLIKTRKLRYFLWFSLSLGLFLTTHNLMPMLFLPIAAVWIGYWLLAEKKIKVTKQLVLGGLLGLGLAAFFVLPVAFERQFVHLDSILSGYFDYRQHFIDLYQLFISNNWGYGSSEFGPGDDLNLSVGLVHWIVGGLAGVLAIVNYKKRKKLSLVAILLLLVELSVLFMMHQKSSFIWSRIDPLVWVQFPWRLMAISLFILSLLAGLAVYFSKKSKIILGIAVIIVAILLNVSFFQPKAWLDITDVEKFSGESWEKQLTISIFDYTPIYAELPPPSKAPELPEVLEGEVDFFSYTKKSNSQTGEVDVTKEARLRLPLYDFPGMKVSLDGKEIEHVNDDCRDEPYCMGLITFDVPEGKHTINAELTNTPIRTIGNTLSLLSISILLYLLIRLRRGNDKIPF